MLIFWKYFYSKNNLRLKDFCQFKDGLFINVQQTEFNISLIITSKSFSVQKSWHKAWFNCWTRVHIPSRHFKFFQNNLSHPYFDPKYIFGVNLAKMGSAVWTELDRNIRHFLKSIFLSLGYPKADIFTEKSKFVFLQQSLYFLYTRGPQPLSNNAPLIKRLKCLVPPTTHF